MDRHTFNTALAESIKNKDASTAQRMIKNKLSEMFKRKNGIIVEGYDDTFNNPFLEISMAAKSFGGEDAIEEGGVIAIYFRSRQGAEDYSNYLEDCRYIETYEINASWENRETNQSQSVVDLESITDDRGYNFEVVAYLYPEYIEVYDDEDDDIPDEAYENFEFIPNEPLTEVSRRIKINSRNVKSIKMKCGRGFKWDSGIKACIKIGGSDLANMRRGARHAIITKRAKGSAFATRVKRKTLRAFKFRKMAGLGI